MTVKWNGGKCKGASHAKAVLRHCDRDERAKTKFHANECVDLERTQDNYFFLKRNYEKKCAIYDARIEELKPNSRIRKDSVTMQELTVYPPDDLPPEKERDFFYAATKTIASVLGVKNLISADVHVDEIHEYIDAETNQLTKSKAHMHLGFVPESNGRLCAKEFCARENIIKVNNAMEKMCAQKFHLSFLRGDGTERRRKSFEEQKGISAKLMREEVANLRAENDALKTENSELKSINQELLGHNSKIVQTIKDNTLKFEEKVKLVETNAQSVEELEKRSKAIKADKGSRAGLDR